jgi:hypothetical protein
MVPTALSPRANGLSHVEHATASTNVNSEPLGHAAQPIQCHSICGGAPCGHEQEVSQKGNEQVIIHLTQTLT